MRNTLTDKEIEKIGRFSNRLIAIEEEIYLLAKIENDRAKKKVVESADPYMYDCWNW